MFCWSFEFELYWGCDQREWEWTKTNINVFDARIINNGDVYATEYEKIHIVRLCPSGSVSTVFGAYPLTPGGIFQSAEGLLVTLRDTQSENYKPWPESRRLVRDLTPTGDVIREYEYREDGKIKLFTAKSQTKERHWCLCSELENFRCELVISYLSWLLKTVYLGFSF